MGSREKAERSMEQGRRRRREAGAAGCKVRHLGKLLVVDLAFLVDVGKFQ